MKSGSESNKMSVHKAKERKWRHGLDDCSDATAYPALIERSDDSGMKE